MLTHEGYFMGVGETRCPLCHQRAELAHLVNDEIDQIVSQFTVCPRCGTFPVKARGSGYIAVTSAERIGGLKQ